MLARVDSGIRLARAEVPAKLQERLRRALSYPNPAYLDRLRLGLSAHGVSERLCFLGEDGDDLRLPRGSIGTLKRLAAVEGEIVSCEDRRVQPEMRLPDLPAPPLRPYQERAVKVMERVTQGTVVIPCGGGKTRIGIGVTARLRTPALVLVHTLDLAEQWRSELKVLLGLDAGLVGDGEVTTAPVTVALVQALARRDRGWLDGFLAGFGLLLLDEAQHVGAPTFYKIVDRCPAKYRFGLTATPKREDGLSALLDLFLGPPIAVVTHDELVEVGVLTLPTVRTVETEFAHEYHDAEDYAPMMAALAADEARNALVADTVAAEARAGHTCLVLSGRVDHCKLLVARLHAAGVTAALLVGEVAKEHRKDLLDDARAGRLSVLVATSLADEGLDLPRLSRVFLAYPGRARGRTMQRLGRLMRPHPIKANAVLFDFVDRQVPILRRHHIERCRLYVEVLGIPASTLAGRSAGSAGQASLAGGW